MGYWVFFGIFGRSSMILAAVADQDEGCPVVGVGVAGGDRMFGGFEFSVFEAFEAGEGFDGLGLAGGVFDVEEGELGELEGFGFGFAF